MTEKERMVDGRNEAIGIWISALTRRYTAGPFGYLEKDQTRGDIKNSHKLFENKIHKNDIFNFFYNAECPGCFSANELLIYYKFNGKFESIVNSGYTDDKKLVDSLLRFFRSEFKNNCRFNSSEMEKFRKAVEEKKEDIDEVVEKIKEEKTKKEFDKRWSSENISEKIKDAKTKNDNFKFYVYKTIQKTSEKMFEEGSKKVTSKGKKTPKISHTIEGR